MRSLFPYAKEAADNTQKIADRCHVTLEFGNYQIPKYAPPEGYDSAWTFLNALCEKGFQEKYTDNPAYDKAQCAKIHEDMEYELGIIQKMGFVEYILIVWDYINWAKTHDCWVEWGVVPVRAAACATVRELRILIRLNTTCCLSDS